MKKIIKANDFKSFIYRSVCKIIKSNGYGYKRIFIEPKTAIELCLDIYSSETRKHSALSSFVVVTIDNKEYDYCLIDSLINLKRENLRCTQNKIIQDITNRIYSNHFEDMVYKSNNEIIVSSALRKMDRDDVEALLSDLDDENENYDNLVGYDPYEKYENYEDYEDHDYDDGSLFHILCDIRQSYMTDYSLSIHYHKNMEYPDECKNGIDILKSIKRKLCSYYCNGWSESNFGLWLLSYCKDYIERLY